MPRGSWRGSGSEIGRASCRERGEISVVAVSSRRRHTRYWRDWSSDVCSSDLRSVFVIEAEDGRVAARGDIPTTPAGFRQLRRQHALPAETPVALESGTVAFYAARELARVGLRDRKSVV